MGGTLNVYGQVMTASLKTLHIVPVIWYNGRNKTLETVKMSMTWGKREKLKRWRLVFYSSETILYHTRHYFFQNLENFTVQRVNINLCKFKKLFRRADLIKEYRLWQVDLTNIWGGNPPKKELSPGGWAPGSTGFPPLEEHFRNPSVSVYQLALV